MVLKIATLTLLICFINSFGFAGNPEEPQSVTGKVVLYEPEKRIVIYTTAEGTKEFQISPKTILQDVNGNPKDQLDLKQNFSVRIEGKTGNMYASVIRPTPDVAGPDYNPTPKPNK